MKRNRLPFRFWKYDAYAVISVAVYIVLIYGLIHVWSYFSDTADAFIGRQ